MGTGRGGGGEKVRNLGEIDEQFGAKFWGRHAQSS